MSANKHRASDWGLRRATFCRGRGPRLRFGAAAWMLACMPPLSAGCTPLKYEAPHAIRDGDAVDAGDLMDADKNDVGFGDAGGEPGAAGDGGDP